ncbi:HNH endonuclease signature motif containing protein [Arthrobacter sp. Sr24]
MNNAAKMPETQASDSMDFRVGDRVHQLLSLVASLVHSTERVVLVDHRAGISVSSTGSGDGSSAREQMPFGLDLGTFSDAESLRWAQDLEQLGRIHQGLTVQSAADITQRVDAGRYAATGVHGSVDLLTQSLKISAAEARRRIGLAQTLLPAQDLITGERIPVTEQQILSEAFFKGQLSVEQTSMISKFLTEARGLLNDDRIDAQTCSDVEETLVETGMEEGPDFLRHAGNRIMSHLDPDGQKPTPGDLIAKQGLFFRKPRRGLIHFDGHMTIEQYENLMVAIGTATNPNKHKDINTINTPEGSGNDTTTAPSHDGHEQDGQYTGERSEYAQASTAESPARNAADSPERNSTGSTAPSGDTVPSTADDDVVPDTKDETSPESDGQERLFDQLSGIIGLMGMAGNPCNPQDTSLFTAASSDSADEPTFPETPETPDTPETPETPETSDPPGVPEPPTEPDSVSEDHSQAPPDATKISSRFGLRGQLWPRVLEPWEIPPRPPNAPPEAVPPVYEGDKWFWFAQPGTTTQGWATRQESAASFMATLQPETKQPDDSGNSTGGLFSNSGPLIDLDPSEDQNTMPNGARQERVVEGVRIPPPGSGEILDELDSSDPASTDPVTKDTRTYGQKLLDGLLDCVKLAARTDKLPVNGGLKTQLFITVSQADIDRQDGAGTAFTTYTGPVSLALFGQSLCDPDITRIGMGEGQQILRLGRTQRLFTAAQRKVLQARDLGCCFPDCTMAAPWTEAHHVIPWQQGGETNIDNGALLCSRHHTLIHHSDWVLEIVNGTPTFTAPYFIDPSQTPRSNTYHRGLTKNIRISKGSKPNGPRGSTRNV